MNGTHLVASQQSRRSSSPLASENRMNALLLRIPGHGGRPTNALMRKSVVPAATPTILSTCASICASHNDYEIVAPNISCSDRRHSERRHARDKEFARVTLQSGRRGQTHAPMRRRRCARTKQKNVPFFRRERFCLKTRVVSTLRRRAKAFSQWCTSSRTRRRSASYGPRPFRC